MLPRLPLRGPGRPRRTILHVLRLVDRYYSILPSFNRKSSDLCHPTRVSHSTPSQSTTSSCKSRLNQLSPTENERSSSPLAWYDAPVRQVYPSVVKDGISIEERYNDWSRKKLATISNRIRTSYSTSNLKRRTVSPWSIAHTPYQPHIPPVMNRLHPSSYPSPHTTARFASSATAHVSIDSDSTFHDHEHQSQSQSPARKKTLSTSSSTTQQPRQQPPSWALLPPSFHPLPSRPLKIWYLTATSFRTAFETQSLHPTQLATHTCLVQVFGIFRQTAERSSWAWLASQLRQLLTLPTEQLDMIPTGVLALALSVEAHALAVLGQRQQALDSLDKATRIKSRGLDHYHIIRAMTYIHLEDEATALEEMKQFIRPSLKNIHATFDDVICDCLESYSIGRREEMLELITIAHRNFKHHLLQGTLPSTRMMRIFYNTLASIPRPTSWLAQRLDRLTPDTRPLGPLLFVAMVRLRRPHGDTVQVYRMLRDAEIGVPALARTSLARRLSLRHPHLASELLADFRNLENLPRLVLSRMLLVYTRLRDFQRSVEIWQTLVAQRPPRHQDVYVFARLHAQLGDVRTTIDILRDYLGPEMNSETALNIQLMAYTNANDPIGARTFFDRINSLRPSLVAYNNMLHFHASRGDVTSTVTTFDQMLDNNLRPDVISYTNLIDLFASKRDIDNARSVFSSMLSANIEPDLPSYASLLNAYVEAGDWIGAAERFSTIPSKFQYDPRIINTVLKAHVLLASPTSHVLQLFRSISKPSAYAWALVIQSACDNDDFELSKRLFEEMDHSYLTKPDVYTFSILLHGYLRGGYGDDAKETFDEMRKRDILPSSVTYGMIITSFTNVGTISSLEEAHEFAIVIKNQAEEGKLPERKGERDLISKNLFGPLLLASGKKGDTEAAEGYFDLVEGDSTAMYGMLMDAYRRVGETEKVVELWERVFEKACEMTTVLTDQEGSSLDNPSTSSSSSSEALSPTKSTIPPALTSTTSSDSATPSVFSSSTISSLGGSDSTSTTNPSSHTVSPSVSSSTSMISDSSPTQTSQLKDPQQATTHPIRSIRTNSTILCIPLSITLDALCHAKRYHDLRKVWQQTFDAGFGLDAANWNHYAVALARMGDVERAFKVVQDVLLVRWDEINSRRERALREVYPPTLSSSHDHSSHSVPLSDNPYSSQNNSGVPQPYDLPWATLSKEKRYQESTLRQGNTVFGRDMGFGQIMDAGKDEKFLDDTRITDQDVPPSRPPNRRYQLRLSRPKGDWDIVRPSESTFAHSFGLLPRTTPSYLQTSSDSSLSQSSSIPPRSSSDPSSIPPSSSLLDPSSTSPSNPTPSSDPSFPSPSNPTISSDPSFTSPSNPTTSSRPSSPLHNPGFNPSKTSSKQGQSTKPRDSIIDVGLDLVRHWRPTDILWRPTFATMSILDHVYSQIESGVNSSKAWMALGWDENEELDEDLSNGIHKESHRSINDEDLSNPIQKESHITRNDMKKKEYILPEFDTPLRDMNDGRCSPKAMLMRLNKKYTRVVALIMLHRRKMKR